MKRTIGFFVAALVATAFGVAHADLTKKVQQTFRGQIIVTSNTLPAFAGMSEDETMAVLKKARVKEVTGKDNDGVAEWTFDYLAFLNKPPKVNRLSVDFFTADKANRYVANKGLMGIDPNLPILSGTLSINEDDGPVRGRTYRVKITGKVKGKDVSFAETTLTLK